MAQVLVDLSVDQSSPHRSEIGSPHRSELGLRPELGSRPELGDVSLERIKSL
jgi:hypothetical protein